MAQDVTLNSSLRQNLLSLQRTARVLDTTTLRLATGLKVNSALDNPQNFFTAQALSNTASDLSRLLDGINLSIRTVQQASTGLQALSNLAEQAEAVARQGIELNTPRPTESTVTGNRDIAGPTLTTISGINNGSSLQVNIKREGDSGGPLFSTTIAIDNTTTAYDVVRLINNLNNTANDEVVSARTTENGALEVQGLNRSIIAFTFTSGAGATGDAAMAAAFGFEDYAQAHTFGLGAGTRTGFNITASRSLVSFALYNNGQLAERTDLINTQLVGVAGTTLFTGLDNAADAYVIGIDGEPRYNITLNGTQTIQNFINAINNIDALQGRILAEFNDKTGQIIITALDQTINSIEVGITGNGVTVANFGFTANTLLNILGGSQYRQTIKLGSEFDPSISEIQALERDYDQVLEQISTLSEDANFRGISLLNGDDLTTYFNADLTSKLVTKGVKFTSQGLGFGTSANFGSLESAQERLDSAKTALVQIRSYARSVANNLAILQARETFIRETVIAHDAGSRDLTIADANKEGANLLALQTRRALGTTSLSLAAQSQQSVLRLF